MALSLSNLKSVRAVSPPRMLIYGPPGEGKTTLASEFPGAVFLQIEDGTPGGIELQSFGKLSSYGQVVEAIQALLNEDHSFTTVVVDSVTELEKLIFAETCARGDDKGNVKANIEDFGYGKGYVYAQRVTAEFLDGMDALRDVKGMTVVLIAHSTIERFDDPETASYDRYKIDLHKQIVGAVERDMDCIFLLKKPVVVEKEESGFNKERARAKDTGDVRLMHTIGRPAFVAKNRYGIPSTIRYDLGKGYEILSPYLPNPQQTHAALDAAHKREAA